MRVRSFYKRVDQAYCNVLSAYHQFTDFCPPTRYKQYPTYTGFWKKYMHATQLTFYIKSRMYTRTYYLKHVYSHMYYMHRSTYDIGYVSMTCFTIACIWSDLLALRVCHSVLHMVVMCQSYSMNFVRGEAWEKASHMNTIC